MSIESRVNLLATAVGTDVKAILADIGDLSALSTTAQNTLVAAINEVVGAANSASGIDDAVTAAGSTWSSNKIASELSTALSNLATGAPGLLDTLDEIAAALEDNPDVIAALRTLITANATAISTLATNVGDTNADFVATYTAARDA